MTTSEVAEVQKRFNAWADEQIGACEETPAHTPDRQLQLDTKIDTLRSAKLNLATFMALNLFCTIEGQCNARWAGRRCNLFTLFGIESQRRTTSAIRRRD